MALLRASVAGVLAVGAVLLAGSSSARADEPVPLPRVTVEAMIPELSVVPGGSGTSAAYGAAASVLFAVGPRTAFGGSVGGVAIPRTLQSQCDPCLGPEVATGFWYVDADARLYGIQTRTADAWVGAALGFAHGVDADTAGVHGAVSIGLQFHIVPAFSLGALLRASLFEVWDGGGSDGVLTLGAGLTADVHFR